MIIRRSTSLGFNWHGCQCRCFWIIPNAPKRFEIVDSYRYLQCFPSSYNVWHRSGLSNTSNSSSNLASASESFFSSRSESSISKRLNQFLHVMLDKALSPYVSIRMLCSSVAEFFRTNQCYEILRQNIPKWECKVGNELIKHICSNIKSKISISVIWRKKLNFAFLSAVFSWVGTFDPALTWELWEVQFGVICIII